MRILFFCVLRGSTQTEPRNAQKSQNMQKGQKASE